jgi:hypothetical protein
VHPGDTQQFQYTVDVTKGAASDSGFVVSGSAIVTNASGQTATITSISGTLGANALTLDCDFTAPGELPDGDEVTCTYVMALASGAPTSSTVTVATSGAVDGAEETLPVAFAMPTSVVNDNITVNDSAGQSWGFSNSGSETYFASHGCAAGNQRNDVNNTVTIVETGQQSSVTLPVYCHVLRVNRSANTGFERTWEWDIDKSHSESGPLVLTAGQTYLVPYTITATASAGDGSIEVNGSVQIINTNIVKPAVLQSLTVDISGLGAADVDCPSLSIAPDTTLTCTFAATLPDLSPRTATTHVTQINFDHAFDGTATANGGTTSFIGHVPITPAGSPDVETDFCAALDDLYLGEVHDLGTACADESPIVRMFSGPVSVTAESACEFEVPNVASFLTQDSGTSGSDRTLLRVVRSDCDEVEGCVLTPGYWKTHSALGPAPYDETWALIGENTPFFLATDSDGAPLSWYAVLWAKPGGKTYFTLARAYIAATLNGLNGASASTQVLDAMAEAEALLEVWTVQQVADLRGNTAPRPRMIELAGILDMYNNGVGGIGPDSCSEDTGSDD